MSDTHGPARRLVERAFDAVVDVEEIEKFSLTLEDMNAIRASADALDACPLRIIRSEEEYEAALARVSELMDAEPGTRDEDELFIRACLVEQWEKEHYPIELPALWPTGPQAAAQLGWEWHIQETAYFHAQTHGNTDPDKPAHEVIAAAVLAKLAERWQEAQDD